MSAVKVYLLRSSRSLTVGSVDMVCVSVEYRVPR